MAGNDSTVLQAIEFKAKATEGDFLVRGDMTFATASMALKQASVLLKGDHQSIRFDLAGISRADSSGVGLLVEWLQMARLLGCQMRYSNIPASLDAMIRVGGVQGMLPIDT
jgi:phospholipid transport system transporter-binding protein